MPFGEKLGREPRNEVAVEPVQRQPQQRMVVFQQFLRAELNETVQTVTRETVTMISNPGEHKGGEGERGRETHASQHSGLSFSLVSSGLRGGGSLLKRGDRDCDGERDGERAPEQHEQVLPLLHERCGGQRL